MTDVGDFAVWCDALLQDLKAEARLMGYTADDVCALALTRISARALKYEVEHLATGQHTHLPKLAVEGLYGCLIHD
jgi:hypothetical protein